MEIGEVVVMQRRILNPIDFDGNISRCKICDSKYHWKDDCPAAYENFGKVDDGEQRKIVGLFQSKQQNSEEMKVFVVETFNCAVLDTDSLRFELV